MNISTLCEKINLQDIVRARVISFSDAFDFSSVNRQLMEFRVYEKMSDALTELQALLGDDPDHIKILACMLRASADVYELYREKGISNEIFFATMRCYPRFIGETCRMTGKPEFDRYWWTTRQAGGHLFRIGELEYETKHTDGNIVISIHIPSDADFSPSAVDESLLRAKEFFAEHFPALSDVEYRCHSWLLDPQLKQMLNGNSHILSFQNRFEIFDEGEVGNDFLDWLFHTKSTDYAKLPENTSLQRNVKKHLLSGGVIRNAFGRLKV